MCTVTFIPVKESIFLTSNRDEKNWRTDALPPAIQEFGSGKMLFPKDGDAGGTWIASHCNSNVVIFLNGAFKGHTPTPPYRKSRGLILLDLIDHTTPFNCFMAINLNNIEPFTAIIRDNGHLFECRWDGQQKHYKEIDQSSPHIWSSSTLYSDEVIEKRRKWFEEWITANPEPTSKEILHFHEFTGDGDQENDLRMNRNGKVFTVSITLIEISDGQVSMEYLDLKNHQSYSELLQIESSTGGT
jgi:hypothetical protein